MFDFLCSDEVFEEKTFGHANSVRSHDLRLHETQCCWLCHQLFSLYQVYRQIQSRSCHDGDAPYTFHSDGHTFSNHGLRHNQVGSIPYLNQVNHGN